MYKLTAAAIVGFVFYTFPFTHPIVVNAFTTLLNSF